MSDHDEKAIESTGVIIAPISLWNRWRDLILLGMFLCFCMVVILGWRETSIREKADKETADANQRALDSFKKDTASLRKSIVAFQKELDAVKKNTVDAEAFKKEMTAEFKVTRKMVFEAWNNHKIELDSMKKTLERIEKKGK